VYGRTFNYPATATNTVYGVGCAFGTISADSPFAGDEFFRVYLGGAPAAQPAILVASVGAGSFPLTAAGMGLCFFNLDPNVLFFFSSSTNSAGSTSIHFPLPDAPLFTGNVFWQWFHCYPGSP
jgi:hypothetical protein